MQGTGPDFSFHNTLKTLLKFYLNAEKGRYLGLQATMAAFFLVSQEKDEYDGLNNKW